MRLPDYVEELLISMLDGEPAPLGLSDALTLQMEGYLQRGGEQRVDGWYYSLSDAGRTAALGFQEARSKQDSGTGAK